MTSSSRRVKDGKVFFAVSPLREFAEDLYTKLRMEQRTHEEALEECRRAIKEHPYSKSLARPPLPATLTDWVTRLNWEQNADRKKMLAVLAAQQEQATDALTKLDTLVKQAHKVMQAAFEGATHPESSVKEIQKWAIANKTYLDLLKQLDGAREKVQRLALERVATRESMDAYDRIYRELMKEYADKGPQYEILVRRAASAEMRLRLAEKSGRDVESKEFKEWTTTVVGTIQQMQKYTEAEKREMFTTQINQVGTRILEIVERHLQDQPARLRLIGMDIKDALKQGAA